MALLKRIKILLGRLEKKICKTMHFFPKTISVFFQVWFASHLTVYVYSVNYICIFPGLVCEPSYSLCVADQSRSWKAGKTLVFDDSFLHSVSHIGEESDIYRAVLIVDIWHPDLTSEERDIIDTVFAPDD